MALYPKALTTITSTTRRLLLLATGLLAADGAVAPAGAQAYAVIKASSVTIGAD
ncbi:hypothetical protein [Variovorax sp. PBL-E5]|uniref:hypothetical protein n=1 Tax=Variovorax sp. PBL-E5 TaxID=434014 RepID=UPI0013161BD4|nr:hypothetical protein [Variovorax sp. PBL-E5]VTU28729.1 hypothetical protein E5CHR_02668 [Variovorax sp. PBL-E5]